MNYYWMNFATPTSIPRPGKAISVDVPWASNAPDSS
jgi:hypothetical protein